MATLAEEIRALLQSIGPDLIPQAQGLPAVAPQSVQSGTPTPQNIGQTLGPQPGDPRNATRQQLGQEFTQAAGSFAASAADPLGIPSAITGMVSPEMRDAWRQYQGAAGPVVQMAGGMASGFPAAGAMLRGGNALAGMPGMIGGGMATGAGPAIDYATGAPGSTSGNAMVSPAIGAAFPLGQLARAHPRAAAGLAWLGLLGLSGDGGEATAADQNGKKKAPTKASARPVAQPAAGGDLPPLQPLPDLTDQERTLHTRDPALAASYQQYQMAYRQADAARRTAIIESRGPTGNSGARGVSERADTALERARTDYVNMLRQTSGAANAAAPSWRDAMGPIIGNPLALQFGFPLAAGAFVRGGGSMLARNRNARTSTAIDEGNTALAAGNIPLAQQYSTNANAMLAGAPRDARGLGISGGEALAGGAAGEMAAFAPLLWDRGLPPGRPEQAAAAATLSDPAQVAATFGRGMLGGIGAYKMGNVLAGGANNYLGGRNLIAPTAEAGSLATRIQQAQPNPPPPQQYRGPFRDNFRDTVANAVTNNRGQGFNRTELLNGISVYPTRRPQLESALREVERDLAAARTAAERLAIAQRIRSGGYPNLVIAGGAAGAAAHHSLSQPRGDDGRFATPEE